MSMFLGLLRFHRMALVGLAAVLLLALFSSAAPTRAQTGTETGGDFGDAPDRTNNLGVFMHGYPNGENSGPPANYPTVFDASSAGPQGPIHRSPSALFWLGDQVSVEHNADQLPDQDLETNILRFGQLAADVDHKDDSVKVSTGVDLPNCAKTRFNFKATAASSLPANQETYVNVWLDYNRDGDWRDSFSCTDANNIVRTVQEWSVQNQAVSLVPGANIVTSNGFISNHPPVANLDPPYHIWMRITLAETQTAAPDGSGPATGYEYGETEDFLLYKKEPAANSARQSLQTPGPGDTFVPEVSYYITY